MRKVKLSILACAFIIAAGMIFSFDSWAKLPVDTTIEDSRDCGEDLYEAAQFHNVLDLDITASDGSDTSKLHDERYSTSSTFAPGTTVTVTCDTKMHGTFIVWDSLVPEWEMIIDGTSYTYGKNGFLHEYVELPVETNSFTIVIPDSSTLSYKSGTVNGMRLSDIYAFDSAELPSFVQTWDAPSENADILIVVSHADDEDIFFGGIAPTYAAEQGLIVQNVYFENHWEYEEGSKIREHEKLCGLWCSGVKNYPITSDFGDAYSESVAGATNTIPWDDAVTYAVQCIRRTHPLVVVTHAPNGEYGHGQHMLTSAATAEAIKLAADSSYDITSAETYGVWNTPKFYVHMSETNQLNLDYRTPLSSFDGKTAIEVARQSYLCHQSQQYCWFTIDDYGPYSNACFGLEYTTVGFDEAHNDLMENISRDNVDALREESAKEKGVTAIYTADDLYLLGSDPYGSFKLMNDIDMTGYEWTPVTFCGTFNGNGNAILNLNVTSIGSTTRDTYDGNMKVYDTSFAGLFDVLDDATVSNLKLLGVNVSVDTETDCFVAPLAGYIEHSTIDSCTIEGSASLYVNAKMFGVGGIVGYGGDSEIKNTDTDMTLICVDKDAENRDEQFMGGGYGAGFINFDNCNIKIDGYDSDHGYVHNGGLVGMYVFYPAGLSYQGYVQNTRTEGMITFFEDNTDRRAYCAEFWGEVMNWDFTNSNNSSDFVRNEVFDYSTDLMPHYCSNPTYTEERITSDCSGYTYTLFTCNECGYSYKGAYEVPQHNLGEAEVTVEPTYEETGVCRYLCADCGKYVYEVLPVKEKIVIEDVYEASEYTSPTASENAAGDEKKKSFVPLLVALPFVGGAAGVIIAKRSAENKRRRNAKRRRNRNRRQGR